MTASIPTGRDFEIALLYLDDELSEHEQIEFELRLSDDPVLASQFDRLAVLDNAQRRLAAARSQAAPNQRRDAAPPVRSFSPLQVAAAAALTLIGGGVSWHLLGNAPEKAAAPEPTYRSVELPQRQQHAVPQTASEASRVFWIGFQPDGSATRLRNRMGVADAFAGQAAAGLRYRMELWSQIGSVIEASIDGGVLSWPSRSIDYDTLVVGVAPLGDETFLPDLDAHLLEAPDITRTALRVWLLKEHHIEVGEFAVEH